MPGNLITKNVRAYKILFELERLLRRFITEVLHKHYEDGWLKGVPKDILKKCEERASRERKTYQEVYTNDSNLVIDYADFRDLNKIIIKNWSIFEPCFIRKDLIENKLEELEMPRNIIAHNRIISNTEMNRISVYANDLKSCVRRRPSS